MVRNAAFLYSAFLLLFFSHALPVCLDSQIDINSASPSELQKIKGIGPVYAQRIIENRPFKSLDELKKVKGIGDKTLEKIKEQGLACVGSYNFSFFEEKSGNKNYSYDDNEIIEERFLEREKNKDEKVSFKSNQYDGTKNDTPFFVEGNNVTKRENYGEILVLNNARKEGFTELVYQSNFDKVYNYFFYSFIFFSLIVILIILRD